jgi:ubiquinone/menaquinone biosynthesis C-methylase UbiE
MYVERDDFLEHEREYQGFRRCVESLGLPLASDSTVLDLGGGQGMHAGFLSCDFRRVYCCDRINYSALYGGEFIKLLAEKYARNGHAIDVSRIAFLESDALDLLFRDGFFDWTLAFNLFEHVEDPGMAMREMIRVTRPGGHLYVTFDPVWTADTGSHFFHLVRTPWAHLLMATEEYAARMRQAGASEEEVEGYRHGMNRVRLAEHRRVLHAAVAETGIRVIEETSWSGVVEPSHRWHLNFFRARMAGYSKEELLTRGVRYVLQKPAG